jgi:lysophospholipase L1-like esterase
MHLRNLTLGLALFVAATACTEPMVEFAEGDHIVLIGNSLADRMQHDGWLESYLQLARPRLNLVVRNQGFTGDRIDARPRVRNFPSADEYLAHSEADWVFAMFGYNESYDNDPAGFGAALSEWIDHTREQDYSGDGPPTIVLFSPIAHEDLDDPNLPDGAENNVRLAAYTQAMEVVALQKGVHFIDLFRPSLALYGEHEEPLTINGVHLNSDGNRAIAEHIVRTLLGKLPGARGSRLEEVRQAVLAKNFHWHNRFRTTDGNDVWGSRATLAFTDGQTNFEVLQKELEQLDVMTANRDAVVWAAARGETMEPDDSNVPPAVEVISNLNPEDPQLQGGVSGAPSTT